ncbi:MAG: helix-turn-helix transcriptional regulator [Acetatifactor sp.]|nr:helix-turn-helix transcriptional regulator [Acetatifactor sp.]
MTEDRMDFNSVNSDFPGTRTIQSGSQELVSYHQSSAVRIWCNDIFADFDPHWHTALEILMPEENWYDAIIREATYHLVPGDILLIPSGELHALRAPEKGVRYVFLLNISPIANLHGFSSIESVMDGPLFINKNTYPHIYDDVYHILLQMRNEYFSENEFAELAIFSLLLNLFIKLGNNHLNSVNLFHNARPYKQKEYINKFNNVMEYIDAHYMDEFTLDDIASANGFSKYHFSRLFKQYTGYSFCSYICRRRIKIAEELLEQPDLSITEIAMQSGFPSISTFNRVFRQQKNCSPSEYREKNSHAIVLG